MGLSREEYERVVAGLKSYFPQENFLPTGRAAALWYERLKDIPYDILQAAIHMHVETSKFPPTIAEIREKASRLSSSLQAQFPETEEVMEMIDKATQRASYFADEEFEKLPKVVQKLVGSPNGLRTIAAMDEDDARQMFTNRISKQYETIVKREKMEALYSTPIQDLIAIVDKDTEAQKMIGNDQPELKRLPGSEARRKYEELEGYSPLQNDEFTETLKLRFGTTSPRKE